MKFVTGKKYCVVCAWAILALLAWRLGPALKAQCPMLPSQVYALEQYYEAGRFEQIASMSGCADTLYEATERHNRPSQELRKATESFYHLYILSNLALERKEKAEEATIRLLERFPRHEINENLDPPHLKMMLDSLIPYPCNHFGAYAGANMTLVQVPDPVPIYYDITTGGPLTIGPKFRNRPRIDVGLEWQHHIGYRHSLITGIGYQALSYATDYASSDFTADNAQVGDWSLSQYDKYNFVKIPLSYQYRIPFYRLKHSHQSWWGFHVGGFARIMAHSESEMLATNYVIEDGTHPEPQTSRFTVVAPADRRQLLTGGLKAGLTYQGDYGYFSYFVRLEANWGLSQMRKANSEFEEEFQEVIWLYHLSDQNFKLHSLQLSAGFLLPSSFKVQNLKRL